MTDFGSHIRLTLRAHDNDNCLSLVIPSRLLEVIGAATGRFYDMHFGGI